MKIILDENGSALSDVSALVLAKKVAKEHLDAHVSNFVFIDCLRAELLKIEVSNRPVIEWVFYGRPVEFNADMRSNDAWDDPRSNIQDDALMTLMDLQAASRNPQICL